MDTKQMSTNDRDIGICWGMALGSLALAGHGARHAQHELRVVTMLALSIPGNHSVISRGSEHRVLLHHQLPN